MPFGFGSAPAKATAKGHDTARSVVGGGLADALAGMIGGVADSPLQSMLMPLNALRTAGMLAQGQANVTPSPMMPVTELAQRIANRYAPPPTTTGGKIARFATSMAVPLPGPAKEMEAARLAEQVADHAPQIVAYHGSPHTFDRFDAAKIGTGEGAQVYGHGLYFAEKEDVAKNYRDALKWKGTDWSDPESVASFWVQNKGGVEPAKQWLQAAAKSAEKNPANHSDPAANKAVVDALDLLNNGYTGEKASANPGSMYQVGINAHPDHFLDWDKPLSEQHPKVQEAAMSVRNAAALADYQRRGTPQHLIDEYLANANAADLTGEQIVRGMKGNGLSEDLSAKLNEAGIPGIKYLDQGSRTAGDGTRNYVVFDPKNIDILKRYGIAATAVGGGALSGAAQQQPQQPTRFGF